MWAEWKQEIEKSVKVPAVNAVLKANGLSATKSTSKLAKLEDLIAWIQETDEE